MKKYYLLYLNNNMYSTSINNDKYDCYLSPIFYSENVDNYNSLITIPKCGAVIGYEENGIIREVFSDLEVSFIPNGDAVNKLSYYYKNPLVHDIAMSVIRDSINKNKANDYKMLILDILSECILGSKKRETYTKSKVIKR